MIPSVSCYVLCVFTSLHQPAMMQHGKGQEVHSRHVSDAAEPESSFYAARSGPLWAQSLGQRFSTSEATTEEGTDLCINRVGRPDGTMRRSCNVWSMWFMFQPATRRCKSSKLKTRGSGAARLPSRGPDHRYIIRTVHDYKLVLTHVKHHMRPWCVTHQASFDCRMLPGYQIAQPGAVCCLFQCK